MRKIKPIILPLAGVASLVAFIVILFPCKSASKAYESLEIGSKYSELLSVAGKPSYETDGTKWVEPEHDKSVDQLTESCVREAWYENRFKFPAKYAFCFNGQNVLVDKYHWVLW